MTGSVALDIVIGLVFIYLLYSLFATLIQEIIATNLSFRAKILEVAIIRMLNDDRPVEGRIKNLVHRGWSIFQLLFKRKNEQLRTGTLADHFYKSPLIKYLAQDSWHSKPSYLNGSNFSKTIIDLLRGKDAQPGQDFRPLIQKSLDERLLWNEVEDPESKVKTKTGVFSADSETLQFIKSLWADSQGDIEKFKALLEKWFDDTMERATGWYKQYTQLVLLLVGFGLAVIFNVDTLLIVDKLSNNPKLTAQLVQQADNFVKAHPNFNKDIDTLYARRNKNDSASAKELITHRDSLFAKSKELLDKDIKGLNQLLGLGWVDVTKDKISKQKKYKGWFCTDWRPGGSTCWALSMLGWFLTALAISLGAPFWFDLLNKLMKLRGSVATTSSGSTEKGKTADNATLINPKG